MVEHLQVGLTSTLYTPPVRLPSTEIAPRLTLLLQDHQVGVLTAGCYAMLRFTISQIDGGLAEGRSP